VNVESTPVDSGLVAAYLDRLHEVGRLPVGGVWRPAYSPAWDEARHLVRGWLAEAGLAVREDAVGNLFGRLESAQPGPAILVGSHIDSVYAGGKFDGPLGVVGAIAAVRALMVRQPRPARPVEVFVSGEEEDSRFICNFWGARALTGEIDPAEAGRIRDGDGVLLADAMRAYGLEPARIPTAARDDVAAMLELHIEQGPVLEQTGDQVGLVEAICGLCRLLVTVRGRSGHAATTPMAMRADALLGAAEIVTGVRRIVTELGEPARGTVGRLEVRPNQPVVIADEVSFIIDTRHPDRAAQEGLIAAVRRLCEETAGRHGLTVETRVLVEQPPTPMDPGLVALLAERAAARGWRARRMVSGAGHDSMIVGRRFPAAMIFVPSRGGVSHAPAEYTAPEQWLPGVQLLADALVVLATDGLPRATR
jgi:allantoate deiminase